MSRRRHGGLGVANDPRIPRHTHNITSLPHRCNHSLARQLSLDRGGSVRVDVLDRLAERHEEDTLQKLLRTIGDTTGPVPL